ncbi:hypothetical protein EMPS_07825 [Entomortierella parvispora]|uniref:Uncharacterized protein n=1 Tax=Entomortierella parvispora TaxID=205924 RepID=A0A9P3HFN0_9FUNG|nr:hypothetical protein EMPS_07825 [Entomortierella parvispora]
MVPFCDAEGWGPVSSTRVLDVTTCVQDSVLLVLPSATFLIAAFPRFFIVLSKGSLEGVTSTPAFRAKTTAIVAAFVLQVALLAIIVQSNVYASSAILSSVLYLLSILTAFALHNAEHFNMPNPSGTLLLYWLFTALFSIFPTRTWIQKSPNGLADPLPLLKLLFTIVTFVVFGLENISKSCHQELKRPNVEKVVQANPSPEASSNFFVRMTFLWLLPLLNKGTKKTLRMDDIWALHPKLLSFPLFLASQAKIDADEAIARQRAQKKKAERADSTPSEQPYSIDLYSVLMSTVGWSFWSAAIPRLLYIATLYIRPVFFTSLLNFLSSYSANSVAGSEPEAWKGYGYVIAIFVSAVLSGIFNAQFSNICFQSSMKARSALVSLIYRKALRLSSTNKQEGIGSIVNHMSADVDRILLIFTNIYFFASGIIELAVVAYLLYQQIKYSMIAAVGVVILIITACGGMAPAIRASQELIMVHADKRMKLISELVNSIKSTKLYAWEQYFVKNITESRYIQLHFVRIYYIWTAVSATLLYSATTIASFAALSIYAAIATPGMPLDITRMFSALTYINMMGTPLLQTKTAIPIIISGKVSYTRIKSFLESEEINPDNVVRIPQAGASDVAYEVKNGTFGWYTLEAIKKTNGRRENEAREKAEKATKEPEMMLDSASQLDTDKRTDEATQDSLGPVLHDVSFTVKRGSLTAVVGRVGQGKSSLAGALLGEMYKYSGSVIAYGSLAYVAQSAWILNDTVRNNILFGHEYNKERYLQVIKACALISDFKMLVNGDQTLIGEKGINLSGGQRQRISIARAVYADADVYIFDDPLSAVDAHVDRHIFEEAISQILAGKTRIMITNGIHHLQDVDQIIVVKQGRIAQDGSYDDLIGDTEGDLFRLVAESNLTHGGVKEKEGLQDLSGNTPFTEEKDAIEVVSKKDSAPSSGPLNPSSLCPSNPSQPQQDDLELDKHQVVDEEVTKEGGVSWGVYKNYIQCAGPIGCAIFLFINIVFIAIQYCFQFWLKQWGNDNGKPVPSHSPNYWILCSLGWTLGSVASLGSIYFVSYLALARRASKVLHAGMLTPLVRSPMSFFDITSSGKIVNRFSQDISAIDLDLPMKFVGLLFGILFVLLQFAYAIAATPYSIILLVPLCVCYYYLAGYYLVSSRELKRLDSAARSPMYAQFAETLNGLATIRGFSDGERFRMQANKMLDQSQQVYYLINLTQLWLQLMLDFLSDIVLGFVALMAVLQRDPASTGQFGIVISQIGTLTGMTTVMMTAYCQLEIGIVSVERIREYNRLPSEARDVIPDSKTDESWPQQGKIEFQNYSTRYREGHDLVLKNIDLTIHSGERIGIVGRTGAGKSSVTMALFRIIEAAEGKIVIDGVDISTLGLHRLRSSLAIIPQEPFLFGGTIRLNLDPFDKWQDADIWRALESASLKDYVSSLPEGLNAPIENSGDSLSLGQRQLMSLARAMLNQHIRILCLDEATAAIDIETDNAIQVALRKSFKNCTVLTIAHRINTIMDSDRIIVLDHGRIAEFGTPEVLLNNPESIFYSLVKKSENVKSS